MPINDDDLDQQVDLDTWEKKVFEKHGIPEGLRMSIMGQESGGNVNAVSPTGVRGKWQVTKATARQYGLNRDDPWEQPIAAAKYLREGYEEARKKNPNFGDREAWLASAARYSGGPNAFDASGNLSTQTRDGLTNPAKYAEGIAKRWSDWERKASAPVAPAAQAPQAAQPKVTTRGPVAPKPAQPQGPNPFSLSAPTMFQQAGMDAQKATGMVSPEVAQQADATARRMEQRRAAYNQKGALGRRLEDVGQGLANIGQSAQQGFENVLSLTGARKGISAASPTAAAALQRGREAQAYTAQQMAERQQAADSLASKTTRGLTAGAVGATTMLPVAMLGGAPAVVAATGIQQDWRNDPAGAAINTALAPLPIKAGQAISPIAARIAGGAAKSGIGQEVIRRGIEAAAGGGTNVAQYAGTQALLGREIDPEEAIAQGISGGVLGTAMAPGRQQAAQMNRGPLAAVNRGMQTVGNVRPQTFKPFGAQRKPLQEAVATADQIRAERVAAETPTEQIGSLDPTAPLTTRALETPAGMPPQEAPSARKALRLEADDAKIQMSQFEEAGDFEKAWAEAEAAHSALKRLRREMGRPRTPEEVSNVSAIDREISYADRARKEYGARLTPLAREKAKQARAAQQQEVAPTAELATPQENIPQNIPQNITSRITAPTLARATVPDAQPAQRTPGQPDGLTPEQARRWAEEVEKPTQEADARYKRGQQSQNAAVRNAADRRRKAEGMRIAAVKREIMGEQSAPEITSEPTNRIAPGEYEGGELRRYSRPLEGQPAETPDAPQPSTARNLTNEAQPAGVPSRPTKRMTVRDYGETVDMPAEDRAALDRALRSEQDENPRAYGDVTRPGEPGSGGVSFSPYNDLVSNNRAKVNSLFEMNLNSPEAQGIIADLESFAGQRNIEPRHVDNLLNHIRNTQIESARQADGGEDIQPPTGPLSPNDPRLNPPTAGLTPKPKAADPKAEFYRNIESQESTTEPRKVVVNWGSYRGQGKRAGGMVRGSMSDAPRGEKTYNDRLGKYSETLSREDHSEINLMEMQYPGYPVFDLYIQARNAGYGHDVATAYVYEKIDPKVTPGRAFEYMQELESAKGTAATTDSEAARLPEKRDLEESRAQKAPARPSTADLNASMAPETGPTVQEIRAQERARVAKLSPQELEAALSDVEARRNKAIREGSTEAELADLNDQVRIHRARRAELVKAKQLPPLNAKQPPRQARPIAEPKEAGPVRSPLDQDVTVLDDETLGKRIRDAERILNVPDLDPARRTKVEDFLRRAQEEQGKRGPGEKASEPKAQNFTQFANERGAPSDYDVMDHGVLSPNGRISARAKTRAMDAQLERGEQNREAKREYRAAIERGEVVDPDGKITQEGIRRERRAQELQDAQKRLDALDRQIETINGLGSMAHLPNGKLKAKYQRTVDGYNAQRDAILADYPDLAPKASPETPQPETVAPTNRARKAKTAVDVKQIPVAADGDLDATSRDIETRFRDYLANNFDEAVARYEKMFGKEINTDNARELSADYAASDEARSRYSPAVHEPSSWFAKELYKRMLKEKPKKGEKPVVLFTAGGTGAGKTSTLASSAKLNKAVDQSQIIMDGNLNNAKKAIQKIDQALASGKRVQIAAVYRDPVEAWRNGVLPRAEKRGRAVPIDIHVKTHSEMLDSLIGIAEHYENNPRVEIHFIDNTHGKDRAVDSTVDIFKAIDDTEMLRGQLESELKEAYEKREISKRVYEGTLATSGHSGAAKNERTKPPGVESGRGSGRESELVGSERRPAGPPDTAERAGRGGAESGSTGAKIRGSVRAAIGDESSLTVPRSNQKHAIQYEIRELADIQPSHDPFTFQKNPKYRLTNDRDYSTPANRIDVEEATKAGAFEPRLLLTDDPTATNGPPIIHDDGNVLGGNSRTMMLGRAYKNHPAEGAAYRKELERRAAMFGIDPAEVKNFQQPVLVRRVVTPKGGTQKLITDLNIQPGKALTSTEAASARAKSMPAKTMQFLADRLAAEGADGTLAQALEGRKGIDVLNRLIEDDVIPRGERNRYLSDQNTLTPTAKNEIETMLLGRVFRDADQMKAAAPEMRNRLARIAPHVAKMAGTEWDIAPMLPNAIEAAAAARNQKIDIEMLNQRGFLFGDGVQYSPDELAIADQILRQGPRQLEAAFRRYAANFESAQQGAGLFGDPMPQREGFEDAFPSLNLPKEPAKPQFVADAEARLKNAASGNLAGSGARQLADVAIVTGYKAYKAGMKFSEWAKTVIKEAGEDVRPHLRAAWEKINTMRGRDLDPVETAGRVKAALRQVDEIQAKIERLGEFYEEGDAQYTRGQKRLEAQQNRILAPLYKELKAQQARNLANLERIGESIGALDDRLVNAPKEKAGRLRDQMKAAEARQAQIEKANDRIARQLGDLEDRIAFDETPAIAKLQEDYDAAARANRVRDMARIGGELNAAMEAAREKALGLDQGFSVGSVKERRGQVMGSLFGGLQGGTGGKKTPSKPIDDRGTRALEDQFFAKGSKPLAPPKPVTPAGPGPRSTASTKPLSGIRMESLRGDTGEAPPAAKPANVRAADLRAERAEKAPRKQREPQSAEEYFAEQVAKSPWKDLTDTPLTEATNKEAREALRMAADKVQRGKMADKQKERIISAADDLMLAGRLGDQKAVREARKALFDATRGLEEAGKIRRAAANTWDTIKKATRVTQTLAYGTDVSFAFRQAAPLTTNAANIVNTARAFRFAYDALGREASGNRSILPGSKGAESVHEILKAHPQYDLAQKAGLELTLFGKSEEVYADNVATKLPWIKRTEAANEAFLDYMRLQEFQKYVRRIEGNKSLTGVAKADAIKQAAEIVNTLTGRTDLGDGAVKRVADAMNGIMAAPRLNVSRLQMVNPKWWATQMRSNPQVARQLAGNVVGIGATWGSLLALGAATGAFKVVLDPEEQDFGKIVSGSRRYDITGGMLPVVKLVYQAGKFGVSAEEEARLNTEEAGRERKRQQGKTVDRVKTYLRGRLGPLAAYATDLLVFGEDFQRRPVTARGAVTPSDPNNLAARFLPPLGAKSAYESAKADGAKGVALTAPFEFVGIGARIYDEDKPGFLDRKSKVMGEAEKIGVDFGTIRKKAGEPDNLFKARSDRTNQWFDEYGQKLIESAEYKALDLEQKRRAIKALRANIGDQANQQRPNLRSLDPGAIVRGIRMGERRRERASRGLIYSEDNK